MEIGKVMTTATISDLPEEVLTEVLVRLSVKDILACVCVRKSWYSLIKTRMFITLHSHYHQKISSSSSNPNSNYLLFRDTGTGANEIRVDDIQCKKYLTLEYPSDLSKHLTDEFHLVSNGLICLFDLKEGSKTHPDIYLWNPVIQKYITLPRSPQRPSSCAKTWWKAIAFGFVQEINDYVVVYMAKYDCKNKPRTHNVITCVYNLSTNSWKQIVHNNNTYIRMICHSESVIVNGVAIWIGYNLHKDRILVCFDTKTEMLREISSPESRSSEPVICAFDQSIVYFVEKGDEFDEHDMWILKGDPMNEFVWEKSMTRIKRKPSVRFLGLRNNGEPILHDMFDLISYNLDSHKSYKLVKSWDLWCVWIDDDPNEWAFFNFYKDCRACQPFIIKPFAESLDLLDIDSTIFFARSLVS